MLRSGYLAVRHQVTADRILDCLAGDPSLADAWIQWSADNRSTPAWYVTAVHPRRFEVAYLDHDQTTGRVEFEDKLRACAVYVHHELEQLADTAESFSSPSAGVKAFVRNVVRQARGR